MTKQENLIELCRRGNPAAYTALYNQHSREVYNTILRLVEHTGEAEDLLQESFVVAFDRIGSLRDISGFRAWIKRIAINKSVDWLRKRKIKFVELEPEWCFEEDEMINEEEFQFTVETVNAAVDALTEGARTIFKLFAIEEIPQAEIAEMLGMEHTAVRTQYHRAKHKVLGALKKEGFYGK